MFTARSAVNTSNLDSNLQSQSKSRKISVFNLDCAWRTHRLPGAMDTECDFGVSFSSTLLDLAILPTAARGSTGGEHITRQQVVAFQFK